MAGVCTISIPTRVSEAVENRQTISRINIKARSNTERAKKICYGGLDYNRE